MNEITVPHSISTEQCKPQSLARLPHRLSFLFLNGYATTEALMKLTHEARRTVSILDFLFVGGKRKMCTEVAKQMDCSLVSYEDVAENYVHTYTHNTRKEK